VKTFGHDASKAHSHHDQSAKKPEIGLYGLPDLSDIDFNLAEISVNIANVGLKFCDPCFHAGRMGWPSSRFNASDHRSWI
jgi:hypothetical protein